jgi:hypothetical protein
VNDERGLGAMPKLYGAPAYARPPKAGIETSTRPFSPDDLPIEAERTDLDLQLVEELASPLDAPADGPPEAALAIEAALATETEPDDDGRKPGFALRLPGRKG